MIAKEAKRFSFFQLVHLLEQYHRPLARVGYSGPPKQELIRFRPDDSLAFPTSDVAELETTNDNPTRYRLSTTFFGLYGSVSPLPIYYAEEILRNDQDENTVRDFLDVFHHRLLSLFYRAWLKYRYHFQFDPGGKDVFSQRLFALMGLRAPEMLNQTGLPFVRLLRYTGLFNQKPHSASVLEGLISDFFGDMPARIEQCTGRWVVIKPEQRISLGRESCQLGWDSSIGSKVYSNSSSFRISIGPLHYEKFLDFLPNGENFKWIVFLATLFTTDRLDFDLELRLLEHEIHPIELTSTVRGSQLGWTSWLISTRVCWLRLPEPTNPPASRTSSAHFTSESNEATPHTRSLTLAGRLPRRKTT